MFVPHDGRPVTMMVSSDDREQRAGKLSACMSHSDPGRKLTYSPLALRDGLQGTAVLRVEFADNASAPRITVLDDGGHAGFAAEAREHAIGYRLPCHDNAGTVDYIQLYVFKISGGSRIVLKDQPLLALLCGLKGVRNANVYFDFKEMGCPFDLKFAPMQPYAPNRVGEVGEVHPERRFFLDWLSRQQVDLPRRDLNAVIGQDTLVSVPCTVLNLGNRPGGSASQ